MVIGPRPNHKIPLDNRQSMNLIFRMGRCFFLICLFGCGINMGHAQDYRMKRFGVSEGLPSSEVYCVLQDRQGYMWFGTDRGAVRYDGYRFEVFSTDEGLPDNTVFKMYEGHDGKIWFACFSPELSYYSQGGIYQFAYNAAFKQAGVTPSVKTDLSVAADGEVWIGTYYHGLLVVDPEGALHAEGYFGIGFCVRRNGQYLVSISGDFRAIPTSSPPLALPEDKNFLIDLEEEAGPIWLKVTQGRVIAQSDVVKTPDGDLVVGVGGNLYLFQNGVQKWMVSLPGTVAKVFLDEKNRIWVGMVQAGIKVFDLQGNALPIQLSQLKGSTVSDIMQDRAGSYWFTTTQQGVFFLATLDFPFLEIPQTNSYFFSGLAAANDSLVYFSTGKPWIVRLEDGCQPQLGIGKERRCFRKRHQIGMGAGD